MDHQYRENDSRNIYSNYNQMTAYVECPPIKSIKKIILYRPFHRAIDETEDSRIVLAVSVSQFYQSIAVQL